MVSFPLLSILSLLLSSSCFCVAHVQGRDGETPIAATSFSKVLQKLQKTHHSSDQNDDVEPPEAARALEDEFEPCLVCGPVGTTSTPDDTFFFPGEPGLDMTCLDVFTIGMQGGEIPTPFCPIVTEFFLQSCKCISEPTVSPKPTVSTRPSVAPSVSQEPTASPCFLCGAPGIQIPSSYYDTMVEIPELGGATFPCHFIEQFISMSGIPLPPGMEDCDEVHSVGQQCGCPPLEPTISPAPTTSFHPSVTPSVSPYPTAGPCFLCGDEISITVMYNELDYETIVDVPVLGPTPCIILADFGYFGYLPTEVQCSDVQVFAQECGCPPTEPTMSPAPSISSPPSSPPSVSAVPTAAPCFLCGFEDLFVTNHATMITLPPPMSTEVYCRDLEFFVHSGILFEDVPGYTCASAQAEFARPCGCPMLDPTASPAPSVSSIPSVTPTATASPTAPCSCQGICHAGHGSCRCFCDAVCKQLNDCCDDVDDHCEFDDVSFEEEDYDDDGMEEEEEEP